MYGNGIVTNIEGNKARVAVKLAAECAGCASKSHCHTGDDNPKEITVLNDYGAKVNDRVRFEAETGKVILSAALIWLLPVASMIIGYVVADRFAAGAWPILAAFVFLGLSFFVLRGIDRLVTGGTSFYPRISSVVTKGVSPVSCGHDKA